jgi:twitching motility protein PilT
MNLIDLLKETQKMNASDLHIMAGVSPVVRIDGEIITMDHPPLTPDSTREMIFEILPPEKQEALKRDLQLCYSLFIPDTGYFRIAVYREMGTIGAAIRIGTLKIRTIEELGLPPMISDLTRKRSGLILITGPTGSGKTTTLNSMIELINIERRCKIIMVEDPIEYVHANKRSIVIQQELYTDTPSFGAALRHVLRQDPDVIGVGEMRDLDTISTALTAAETGHLVLSTLHTPNAPLTIERIIDVFPPSQQSQIRSQLANILVAVISQQLLPRVDHSGRVLASELMLGTPAICNTIRTDKVEQLYNTLHTGRVQGMYTMDTCLKALYEKGIITYDTAVSVARYPDEIRIKDGGFDALAPQDSRRI